MKRIAVIILLVVLLPLAEADAVNSAGNFGGVGIDGAPWANGQIVVRQIVAGGPAIVRSGRILVGRAHAT